jgi:peptidoglycan/xylan/chitin deacetylase (PgdA/CDA1 family)
MLRFSLFYSVVLALSVVARGQSEQLAVQAQHRTAPIAAGARPGTTETQITFSAVHVDGPYIAMTFDDGPNEKLTPKLLDLLAAHHIKATFFVVGENAAAHPEILARIVREGHEIGNHSWSHPNFAKMSDEAVRRELRKTDDAIFAGSGIHPTLMRPPYGSITARQKRWIHEEFGYRTILWEVDPLDWKRPGPSVVSNRILRETRNGAIVLSHDIHPGTIAAMPATFTALQEKGFKFVTVSELIAMARPEAPKPGSPPPMVRDTYSPTPTDAPLAGPSPTPAPVPPNG